jgi:hypothetical protein
MAIIVIHFLFDAIASLVALDESDGLLDFKAAFRSFEPQAEVKNAPILLAFVICARVLQVLVIILSLRLTQQTLSRYRHDMSLSAFSALLLLLPALIAPRTPFRMMETGLR